MNFASFNSGSLHRASSYNSVRPHDTHRPTPARTIETTQQLPTMPKERSYNPVQAQRKAEKAKAAKKGR